MWSNWFANPIDHDGWPDIWYQSNDALQVLSTLYYKDKGQVLFPSESPKKFSCWVGVPKHIGDALTWKDLSDKTSDLLVTQDMWMSVLVLHWMGKEPQTNPFHKRSIWWWRDFRFTTATTRVWSRQPSRTHVSPPANQVRGAVPSLDCTKDSGQGGYKDPKLESVKFLLSVNDSEANQIVTYNKVVEYLSNSSVWAQSCHCRGWSRRSMVLQGHYGAPGTTTLKAQRLQGFQLECTGGMGDRWADLWPLDVLAMDDSVLVQHMQCRVTF